MDWACLAKHESGVVLKVRVTPNASRSEAVGMTTGDSGAAAGARLIVRIQAPPVEGKANAAARRWAARAFGLRPSRVSLLRGEKAREKDLLLEGLELERAGAALGRMLGDSGSD
jgi:hypothetical protein